MTITVPAEGQDPTRPPAAGEALEALLRILPDRTKPGLRAELAGSDPGQPSWGQVFLRKDWLASIAQSFDLAPVQGGQSEPIPIRLEVEADARLGPRLVISMSDWPTLAQAATDVRLRKELERQGLWRRGGRPNRLRQLVAVVPRGGGPRWEALAPSHLTRHEGQITHLAEREVDLDDTDAVIAALGDAADFVHWGGADAVLIVTGDRWACRVAGSSTPAGPRP